MSFCAAFRMSASHGTGTYAAPNSSHVSTAYGLPRREASVATKAWCTAALRSRLEMWRSANAEPRAPRTVPAGTSESSKQAGPPETCRRRPRSVRKRTLVNLSRVPRSFEVDTLAARYGAPHTRIVRLGGEPLARPCGGDAGRRGLHGHARRCGWFPHHDQGILSARCLSAPDGRHRPRGIRARCAAPRSASRKPARAP